MDGQLDSTALELVFHQPSPDGHFEEPQATYLAEISKLRPVVALTFAPKAAGTYLRAAVACAIDGQLVRTVHAQGGRDAQFYLPTLVAYYHGGITSRTMVTHVHMQALPGNRHLIEALSLKPVIMLRPVPDMLASFLDMLMADETARLEGLNCTVPDDFLSMSNEARADYVIDIFAPWYASYFATWRAFVDDKPDQVLVTHYREFVNRPGMTLQSILEHSGVPQSRRQCERALDMAWSDRSSLRYNKGVSGRGETYFTLEQRRRIRRILSHYGNISIWLDELC